MLAFGLLLVVLPALRLYIPPKSDKELQAAQGPNPPPLLSRCLCQDDEDSKREALEEGPNGSGGGSRELASRGGSRTGLITDPRVWGGAGRW